MTIILLLVLILSVAGVFHWRRLHRFTTFVTLVFILLVGGGFFAGFLLSHLEVLPPLQNAEWKEHNLIIVLGAGAESGPDNATLHTSPFGYSRVVEAAHQYRKCHEQKSDCKLLLSGGDPSQVGASESEIMAKELEQIGVARQDMVLEDKSRNTFQNARFSKVLVEKAKPDEMVLVTSGFHMRRALLFFQRFAMHPQPAPSDQWNSKASYWPVTYNFAMTDIALHEYFGLAQFYFYEFMGWNKGL